MRHFGAPTRLLDWTYSFFVALYFACEQAKASQECTIWALDSKWCRHRSEELAPSIRSGDSTWPPPTVDQLVSFMHRLSCLNEPFVYPVNPFYLNERLVVQQGVFTWPGTIRVSFEENLVAMGDTHNNIYKIDIAPKAVRACLYELHRMNISRATLYPGLDGFSSSLNIRLAVPETLYQDDPEPE
jgi:hypothetical protein